MRDKSKRRASEKLQAIKLWLCGGAGVSFFIRALPTHMTSNTKAKLQRVYRQESPRLIRQRHLITAQTISLFSGPVTSKGSETLCLAVILFKIMKDGGYLLRGRLQDRGCVVRASARYFYSYRRQGRVQTTSRLSY